MRARWWMFLGVPLLLAPGTWGTMAVDPTLSNPSANSITVRWEMKDNRTAKVEYGTSATTLSNVVENTNLLSSVELELTGLQPGTTYYYKATAYNSAGVPSLTTPIYSFTTAPKRSDAFTFVFAAETEVQDNASPAASYEDFTTWIGDEDPSVLLHAGNHVRDGDATEDWGEYFDRIGEVYAEVPMLAAWGPRDKAASGNTIGEANELATLLVDNPGNERNWSRSYGNTLIVGLELDWGYDGQSEANKTWLSGVLADANDGVGDPRYIIVVMNPSMHPTRSHGGCGNRSASGQWAFDNLKPLFEQHKVSLVLTGENEGYARSIDNGVTYVSTRTGMGFENKACDPVGLEKYEPSPGMVSGTASCDSLDLSAYVFTGGGFGDFWVKTGDEVVESFTIAPRANTACTYDLDNDGADDSVDCDDTDASVKPGGTEICTGGKDEDCDGLVDADDDDCDEPDDTDTEDTDTDDTDTDDTDTEDSGTDDTGSGAQLGCTCSSSPSPLSLGWAGLLGLLALRRRR